MVGRTPAIFSVALALALAGCGGTGSKQGEPPTTSAAPSGENCSRVPKITDFDSDEQLERANVGHLRFITESEARAIKKGMTQTVVFCRLDFPFGGLTNGVAPAGCDESWDWAIAGTGPGDTPNGLENYATWEFCFRNGKVAWKNAAEGEKTQRLSGQKCRRVHIKPLASRT
jgi:hypothetical protein